MNDLELNRTVALARGKTTTHTTGSAYAALLAHDVPAIEPPDVCTDPAAWGALHNELKEAGYAIHMSTYRNVTTVKIIDMKAAYSGDADDTETGRAIAYAFLRVKRVLPEEV